MTNLLNENHQVKLGKQLLNKQIMNLNAPDKVTTKGERQSIKRPHKNLQRDVDVKSEAEQDRDQGQGTGGSKEPLRRPVATAEPLWKTVWGLVWMEPFWTSVWRPAARVKDLRRLAATEPLWKPVWRLAAIEPL